MANYKMVDAEQLDADLTSVANVIRSKGGTSAQLSFPNGFESAIESIETGVDTSDATASASDILSGKTAYVDGEKVTGSIATVTQATPSISVSSAGKITASATQTAGYVSAGTKSATKQITHTNLVAENIKSGVSIFGVTGTMESGVAVQTQDGSFTMDASGFGYFTVNFEPDLLIVFAGNVLAFNNLYECNLTFALNDRGPNASSFAGLVATTAYADGSIAIGVASPLSQSDGTCDVLLETYSMIDGTVTSGGIVSTTLQYRAIKYT